MSNQIQQFAMQLINQNRDKFKNNPQAQNMINIIENYNEQQGIELANNLLNSYGDTKENAMKKALNFLNIPH